ncbi:MAG: hypothetical protein C0448_03360 [Sphingobacteriaceae bacterium]|nr:hypothetical protein [Sphingobacteriaceae bacterium]
MQQQKIEFRRERDFGSILGDSLKFIKQNFKSFFGSVILIVGPFILLMGLGYAYMQTSMMNMMYSKPSNPLAMFDSTYFLSIGVMMFCGLLANILLSGVVYNYMIIYQEKQFGEAITVSEVGKRVWSNIGRLTIASIIFIIVFILILTILVLIGVGFVSMLGAVAGVLLALALIFGLLIFTPVLTYFIPASFFVVVRDNLSIFSSMTKVKKYLSGNFWWTWLIMVVALFGLGILQMLFNLPASIVTMTNTFTRMSDMSNVQPEAGNNILLMVFYTLGMFLTYCTSSISHLISAFNFMSHEEQHEGKGLMSRIDEIN